MRQQGVWQVYERRALAVALAAGSILGSPLQAQAAQPPAAQPPAAKPPAAKPPVPAGQTPVAGHAEASSAARDPEPNSALGTDLSAARDREPGAIARRFVQGDTPGSPSTAKRAVVYGLYGAAGVGTASAAVFIARWLSDRQHVAQHLDSNPGACRDLGAQPCLQLVSLRNDTNRNASWATLSAAVAASALLGAVMTAHLWDNVEVTTSAWPSGGRTHVTVHF